MPMTNGERFALENEVRAYAEKLVNYIVKEYDLQVSKWKGEINRLVDAQQHALNHMNTVLEGDRAAALKAEQEREQTTLAFLTFMMLAGPAASWLGATVQTKLYPRTKPRVAQFVRTAKPARGTGSTAKANTKSTSTSTRCL